MNKTTELETLLTGCIHCGTECEITSSKDFLNWLLQQWANGEIPFYECPECREELEEENVRQSCQNCGGTGVVQEYDLYGSETDIPCPVCNE